MQWFAVGCFLLLIAASQQYKVRTGIRGWVEYQYGGRLSNVVITASHGGTLKPSTLPDRPGNGCYNSTNDECVYEAGCNSAEDVAECGVKSTYSDQNTQYLAVELADSIRDKLGGSNDTRPHVIRCLLHRSKLDANRDLGEAAFGNALAGKAWKHYHSFIDRAKKRHGGRRILYIDVHGQSTYNWNMIGLLLPDDGRNGIEKTYLPDRLAQYSSIMQLHVESGVSMEELVRGNTSIGGLMQPYYNMIPSPANLNAGSNAYYIGGYSLRRHTGWKSDGFQVEVYRDIRISASDRRDFADKLADAVIYWLNHYY